MTSQTLIEGWLTRSRDQGIRFPPFRSKWVRRYFVLRDDGNSGARHFFLDEYRDEKRKRLRKSIELNRCEQVDSYLQLADSSCSARFTLFQWIFSIHLAKPHSKKTTEIYMVAQSDVEMSDWVTELCNACRLEKQPEPGEVVQGFNMEPQNGDVLPPHLPNFRGMSISSGVSTESLLDPMSDVTSEGMTGREMYQNQQKPNPLRGPRPYFHLKNVRVKTGQERANPVQIEMTGKKYRNDRNGSASLPRATSSASACSSMTSSHRSIASEDDASSLHSSQSLGVAGVPPVPPRTRRLTNQLSTTTNTSSSGFGSRNRVPDLDQSVPAPTCEIVEERENESSGETIKLHSQQQYRANNYVFPASHGMSATLPGSGSVSKASSVCSSMAYGPNRGPPVDRSKKPPKLRLERDDDGFSHDGSVHSYSTYGNSSTLTRAPRTPQLPKVTPRHRYRDPPKSAGPLSISRSRELDYFEPGTVRAPFERAQSTRSPDPADLEYIQIDAQKTQAVKKLIAKSSRGTFD